MAMPRRKEPTEITVGVDRYQNGSMYYHVSLGTLRVGAFAERDGGYVLFGARRLFASIERAAKECIRRRARRLNEEANRLTAAMELPVNTDAVDPSVTDTGTPSTRDA